jgi:hypothetical protein
VAESHFGMYGREITESGLLQLQMGDSMGDMAKYQQVYQDHQMAATLDGEDQWTCTPAASSEVPERDQLFDRKKDPFQLNNIVTKHPDKARKLFDQLREYMAELKVC